MTQMISRKTVFSLMFLTVVLLPSFHAVSAFGQHAHPRQADLKWHTQFPRLYYTAEKIESFKHRMQDDPQIHDAWMKILERADRLVDAELVSLEYAESGKGQHGNYGRPSNQISDMGATLGLAYQMTGETKYATKLRQALLYYTQLKRWAGDAHFDPPWHSELNTARFCFGYAIGYDSIHDSLNDSDRKTILEGMIRLGILPTLNDWILPQKRIHALDSMGHNWWSVCVAMAGTACLAIVGEEPQAEEWLQQVQEAFTEWFAYQGNVLQNKSPNFDSKGAFYESVNYANYALYEYLLFHLAWKNVFSASSQLDNPLVKQVGDFFVHTSYPTSEGFLSVNFGDSSLRSSGARTLHYLRAIGIDSPAYQWYLSRSNWGLRHPVGLVYSTPLTQTRPPDSLPTSMIYPDIGWCMMRTSWNDNATMLAVKSGFAWNHAHPDASSFLLFHNGKPLLIDSGNCSYSRREYTSYYRHSKAHNVILFSGEGQLPEDCGNGDRGVVHPGQVLHLMELAGIKYALADATGPTSWKCSRNYRHFLWIDDVILIFDDIRTHKPEQLDWLLHYEGNAMEEGRHVLLSNGPQSQALFVPLYPQEAQLQKRKGLKDHDPDTEVDYLAFSLPAKTRSMKFINAILPLDSSRHTPQPELELLEGDEMLGVRIHRGDKITDVFLNLRADGRRMHRNSNKTIQGWDTDAYLFGITRQAEASDNPQRIERGFVICGSYLRKDNLSMLESLSKVYAVFTQGNENMDVILQGQPVMNCEIHCVKKPVRVTLNNKELHPEWNASRKSVKFHWEKKLHFNPMQE